ncbi:unnamed protein product [Ceutorhynchus assimilis]|uniref:Hsp90 co-chaperone Cdc37 n=1 Tax=Ceutorhynchus assimilis TaxID=467358 RepID=A0A9N9MPJ3_9CUCU|nr:unnamed protein product [Ceutorhynchus assimilis]
MVDYSKWKNIEVSDDEDDTHPNIDTPSLFRWRHQARVERMEEIKKEKEQLDTKKAENLKKLKEAEQKLIEAKEANKPVDDLEKTFKGLEMEAKEIEKEFEEYQKKEKLTPWNVDTISKPGFAKTIINKRPPKPTEENLTEEEREARLRKFIKENEKELKHFGMLRKYEDSRKYLKEYPNLVCENTANHLVKWCIDLEMQEKHDLMGHVAHQTICMQYILELAKQLDCDPRACADPFFSKIKDAGEYKTSFDDELNMFKERIRKRAAEKLDELVKEYEEEERQKRLGPGGLDPAEVYESLPQELQKCFDARDVKLLQETIAKMDEEQAKYHIKRCVDSGLWVPQGSEDTQDPKEEKTE